ncbi:haloalkane dehalogenase [Kribbella qitaiheensis]|uniref:haloalkane dehalogenase n=1 Tax=Kribbella qitaiheensis TaxID=1544730 RepID=UPI002483C1A9|nr:haloalkane dehalogenase [Kribbella qitaiheensis]
MTFHSTRQKEFLMPTKNVLDSTMFYREDGTGSPIVFLHGNPTSSYGWRHIMSAVGDPGRRLAPDLIGMGDSGKPDIDYTFDDHARYLDAWFDALGLYDVVLVGHDWGGALAFDWAARHPGRVRGIAFTETIVKPMSWQEFPEAGRELFRSIKTPGVGETMMLDQNAFIEAMPSMVARLTDEDFETYASRIPRRPAAGRCCAGHDRCHWTASRPTSWPGSTATTIGSRPVPTCPSC